MKTTIDLPEDLIRRVKVRAVLEKKKLKQLIPELLRLGMKAQRGEGRITTMPKTVRLRGGPITAKEIEAAIDWGRH